MSKIDELVAAVIEAEVDAGKNVEAAEAKCVEVKRQSEKKEREIISVAKDVAKNKCEEMENQNAKQTEDFMKVVHADGEKKAKQLETACAKKISEAAKEIADEIVSNVIA